jgi:hypothetical protein
MKNLSPLTQIVFTQKLRFLILCLFTQLSVVGAFSSQEPGPVIITDCTSEEVKRLISQGGHLMFQCGPNPITIELNRITVNNHTRIDGIDPNLVSIKNLAINGLNDHLPIFSISSGASLRLENITFIGLSPIARNNGTLSVNKCYFTGITASSLINSHLGTVTIENSSFINNITGLSPLYIEGGSLIIDQSAFTGNRSTIFGGGAVFSSISSGQTANISNSLFHRNSHSSRGGAVYHIHGSLNVTNCTFLDNNAQVGGTTIHANDGTVVKINNSTVSGNGRGLIQFGTSTTAGSIYRVNNSILVTTTPTSAPCSGNIQGSNNLQWPTTSQRCGNGFNFRNPMLGLLANNGGPTLTMALLRGSPAIDAGSVCASRDQRGVRRPLDGNGDGISRCDIGAYEYSILDGLR